MRGRFALAAMVLVTVVVWAVVLPALSRHPRVAERIDDLERRQIDASAMFYTELKSMEAILKRVDGRNPLP